jgi:hypothetical protein
MIQHSVFFFFFFFILLENVTLGSAYMIIDKEMKMFEAKATSIAKRLTVCCLKNYDKYCYTLVRIIKK